MTMQHRWRSVAASAFTALLGLARPAFSARSREPGANRSRIARELGISETTLYFWVKGAQTTMGREHERP
jgi:predicted transcriptional regulator